MDHRVIIGPLRYCQYSVLQLFVRRDIRLLYCLTQVLKLLLTTDNLPILTVHNPEA